MFIEQIKLNPHIIENKVGYSKRNYRIEQD